MSRRYALAFAIACSAYGTAQAKSTFMPDNNLYLQDNFTGSGGITEAQFNAVIDRAERIFKPIIAKFGGTYAVQRKWDDATVNADAEQDGTGTWNVNMYGGLARRAEVTEDGFAMVLCHETGHHLGGFPFSFGQGWAADEGQADTFATGNCAKMIFGHDPANAASRASVPAIAKDKCDAAYTTQADKDLCYRVMNASKSLADLLAALGGETVDFSTPDASAVDATNDDHPAAQCRLDTYIAAQLCNLSWTDTTVIPGKVDGNGTNDAAAQTQSGQYYCQDADRPETNRPRCWFKSI